jgi:hypothetical protein
MGGEVTGFGMLKDEECTDRQAWALEQEGRECREAGEVIRGIGKDKIESIREGCLPGAEVPEDVSTQKGEGLPYPQGGGGTGNEGGMKRMLLHGSDAGTAPGEEFEGNAPCAGKEIQCGKGFEVNQVGEYVEKVLLGEVGGGPGLESRRRLKAPMAVYTAYDTHDRYKRSDPEGSSTGCM